jgi:hypothetical protein
MDAVHARIAKESGPPVLGQALSGGVHGERDVASRANDDRAGGVDDLLVAAHLVGSGRQLAEQVLCDRPVARQRSFARPLAGGAVFGIPGRAVQPVEIEAEPFAVALHDRRGFAPGFEIALQTPGRARPVAQLLVDLAVQLV